MWMDRAAFASFTYTHTTFRSAKESILLRLASADVRARSGHGVNVLPDDRRSELLTVAKLLSERVELHL
jgi:hypothetical protein